MKKILTTLTAILSIVIATSSFAQDPAEDLEQQEPILQVPQTLPLVMPCGTSKKMLEVLQGDNYREAPIGIGQGTVFMPNGSPVNGQLTLWYNPIGKKNFSIMITFGDGNISCIVSSGINLELLPVAFGTAI